MAAAPAPPSMDEVLVVLDGLLRPLRGVDAPRPGPDDDLERVLGIDSLARVELTLRLERRFGRRLPEDDAQRARTPRDLLRLVAGAPAGAPGREVTITFPAPPAVPSAVEPPHHATTLPEVLDWHAARWPTHPHALLWTGDDTPPLPMDHAALRDEARAVAGALQREGVSPGETVALMLATSLDFLACFQGVLLAGAVPVPLYPPLRPEQLEDHLRRQARILDNAQAVMLLGDAPALPALRVLRAGAPTLRAAMTVQALRERGGPWTPVGRVAADTALIQYTSGSTGQPKGVVLSHANLLANLRAMGQALRVTPADRFASWLPMYHDMGLIGAWLGSLYFGLPLALMSPQAFLGRPARWLRLVSAHRATLSAAPNFAYEMLATRVPDEELAGLDLRCWRAAPDGSEPVHATTLSLFQARFAACGFAPEALMPVYGLAENGVGLAFPPPGRGPRVDIIDRVALHDDRVATPVPDGHPHALRVVGCGMPLPGHELRVVDERGRELPDRHEGRVEFRGPSATAGYCRDPEKTRALFDGEWIDTGDVGYVAGGEIHLTSRAKDLIKRGGHNLHPYELEDAVGALPGVRRGGVAVFGAADPVTRGERVVVLAETRLVDPAARAALHQRIASLAVDLLGAPADEIVLAPPRTVPKTSSGKIRRAACRERYELGDVAGDTARPRRVSVQLLRLWASALRARLRAPGRGVVSAAFAARAWAVFGVAAVAGLSVAAWPGLSRRRHAARAIARAAWRATGLPLAVQGAPPPDDAPVVYVCNHASYLDALLLTAVLPPRVAFVAKRELAGVPLVGWAVARLGTHFVERIDVAASVHDAQALVAAARAGDRLVFFPEGTLTRAAGLRAFHLGAFLAAAQAGHAVVPVSLSGTRSVLRDGTWWPRRGPVAVRLHAPVPPSGASWDDAVALRDRVRERIGSACGEPTLPA